MSGGIRCSTNSSVMTGNQYNDSNNSHIKKILHRAIPELVLQTLKNSYQVEYDLFIQHPEVFLDKFDEFTDLNYVSLHYLLSDMQNNFKYYKLKYNV